MAELLVLSTLPENSLKTYYHLNSIDEGLWRARIVRIMNQQPNQDETLETTNQIVTKWPHLISFLHLLNSNKGLPPNEVGGWQGRSPRWPRWWRREASTGPRAASTAWWPQMQWCFMLLPSWKIPVTSCYLIFISVHIFSYLFISVHIFSYLFITFHVPTGPAHGRHRQMEQVLLVSCFQFQPCLAEATDSAGSRRECTQCTKIPPTQAQLHPVWKLQTLTDRDIRKTGISAGKCEVHRDAQRQLCINNAAGVGPCN